MKKILKDSKVLATLLMIIIPILLYINPKIVLLIISIMILISLWYLLVLFIELLKDIDK